VTFPAFKAGDSALRGSNGGFDFHTPPPKCCKENAKRKSVNKELFNEMISGLAEAKKYCAGKKAKVRVSRAAFEPVELKFAEIRSVRVRPRFSQP